MKYILSVPLPIFFLFASSLLAQSTEDVVTFKNGAVVQGQVLEQWPGVSIKLRSDDGTVRVYRMSDVSKITKFDRPPQTLNPNASLPTLPSDSNPAKSTGPTAPPRAGHVGFGLIAGMDLATESYQGLGSLPGFTGGFFVDFCLSDKISIQPELYFTMKGATSGPDSDHLNYVELPILFKVNFPDGKDLRFDLFTGPAISVLTDAYFSYAGTTYPEYPFYTHGDAGWILGTGLEAGSFVTNLRYEIGFVPIEPGSYGAPLNNALTLLVGCRLFD